jgi:hypothetical protein
MLSAALRCFSPRSGPHFLHTPACEHLHLQAASKALNPPQFYPAKAACHHRRDSVDGCSGLPTFRVTVIVKSRTPRALTPRSSSVYVHRDRSLGRTPWNRLRKTAAVR